jgi:hypothetical protein
MADRGVVDRKPGEVFLAMSSLAEALASLDDRVSMLRAHLEPVRFDVPAPTDPALNGETREERSPLANELRQLTDLVRRTESRLAELQRTVEL